jgi:hypothetical protein
MNLIRSYDPAKIVIRDLLLSDGIRAKAMSGGKNEERANRILAESTSWLVLLGPPGLVAMYSCGRSLTVV